MAHPAAYHNRTEHVNLGKAFDGIPAEVRPAVHDITRRRQGIEEALNHTDDSSETVVNYVKEYLAMQTTLESIQRKVKSSSRLRFKWTSFLEEEKTVTSDIESDMACMLQAAGLWHMKHANHLNKSITDEDEDDNKMKDAVQSLKAAAGIFDCIKSLGNKDINVGVIRALYLQSLAEGQCITIRRAITKGHKAQLISELCHDVAAKYLTATNQIDTSHHLEQKWATYLKFQSDMYFALARCYQGVHLLETDEQCGESIVVLNEATKHIQQALVLAKEYDKIKPKTKVHLDEAPHTLRVRQLINEKKAKSERENGMIYHQRLPEECLPLYDAKCVIQPTVFHIPDSQDLSVHASSEESVPAEHAESSDPVNDSA